MTIKQSSEHIYDQVAEKCLETIKNKLEKDKHKDKYIESCLMVVLKGWQFESIEDLEGFFTFLQRRYAKRKVFN